MKFCPTPRYFSKEEYKADQKDVARKINLSYAFRKNTTTTDGSLIKPPSNKVAPKPTDAHLSLLLKQIECMEPTEINPSGGTGSRKPYKNQNNIIPPLYSELDKLIQSDLVIKEADKGSGVVLMDPEYYNSGILKMLEDQVYIKEDMDCATLTQRVQSFIKPFSINLTKNEFEAIYKQESQLATFYGLPKIHKSSEIKEATQIAAGSSEVIHCNQPKDLKFRPIVSCQMCPTKSLSDMLDKILRPFVKKVKFRLQDTWDFLRSLPTDKVPEDTILVTADITALYTNISTEMGKLAISHYLDKYPELLPPRLSKSLVINAYEFCQNNLYFDYGGQTYRQVDGTGMGRIYAPSLADLKQGYDEILLEEKLHSKISEESFLYFNSSYRRYLDDVWLMWRLEWLQSLDIIAETMNSIDPKIKFTFETSQASDDNSIPFLDLRVSASRGNIDTDMYSKPTDTFNYTPFNSAHPCHVVRNIPYCLAKQVRGIVSKEAMISTRMEELSERLKAKKYPKKLIEDAISSAMNLERTAILHPEPPVPTEDEQTVPKTVFFVSNFDPNIAHPAKSINNLLTGFNNTRREEKNKLKINYSFRRCPSLKQLLMFRKPPGSSKVTKCKGGCTLCNNHMQTGNTLTLKTGVVLKTNANFQCLSRTM